MNSNDAFSLYSESTVSRGQVFAIDASPTQAPTESDKHPVTVALTKSVNGDAIVLRTLVDPCCTRRGLMSLKTAKSLGLEVQTTQRLGTYTSVGGKFKSLGYVKVPAVMLPALSPDKTFALELEVVPDEGHMTYSIIIGQNTMRDLKLDVKISTDEIIWDNIRRPMVSRKYWSNNRMRKMIPVWQRYLKRLDNNKDFAGDDAVNSGYSSRPSLIERDDTSTVSSYDSVTSDATSVTFADAIAEDSVHSSTVFTDNDSLIGSVLSFNLEDMPAEAEVHSSQVLKAIENIPTSLDLSRYQVMINWELLKREKVKREITTRDKYIPPLGFGSLKHL